MFKRLLTTRHQLAIARATLERSSTESHSNFRIYKRIATQALESIKQAGEEK